MRKALNNIMSMLVILCMVAAVFPYAHASSTILSDGFEQGFPNKWIASHTYGSNVTLSTEKALSATHSVKCSVDGLQTSGQMAYISTQIAPIKEIYVQANVRLSSVPVTGSWCPINIRANTISPGSFAWLQIEKRASGVVWVCYWRDSALKGTTSSVISGITVSPNQWYNLKIYVKVDTPTTGAVKCWINGNLVLDKAGINNTEWSSGVQYVQFGERWSSPLSGAHYVYIDDIIVSSSAQSSSSTINIYGAILGGGICEQYTLYDYLLSSEMTPVQKWDVLLDEISVYHFNTLRLAFAFSDCPVGGGLPPILNYSLMESVIAYVYSRGYRVILDLHNSHNMYQYCGSPAWYANWRNVASKFAGDGRIIGFELFNEPYNRISANPTWTQTWYPTIKSKTDLVWAYANLTDQIRAIDKNRTVVWPDPMSYFQTTETSVLPFGSYRENVVFAWHGWAGAAYYADDYDTTISRATNKLNRILWWGQQYPTSKQWIGEFGMYKYYNGVLFDYEAQRDYCATLVNGCINNGWGFAFWQWSNQHWGAANYTDVVLHSNWKYR